MKTRVRMFLLYATALALSGFTQPLGAIGQDDLCGATILVDLSLDHDLTCAGNGLVVGADGIAVNLNGHTIMGSGLGAGIRIAGRVDVTVHGGTVRNFETGVMVANSSRVVVKEIAVTETREGIFLNGSSDCVIKENRAWLNQIRGIMVRPSTTRISTRNYIGENTLSDNPVGILLFGQSGNRVLENTITGSALAGILLTGAGASGNVFKENSIRASATAIQFGPDWIDNRFIENTLTFNTCGLQGVTVGNEFRENVFANNGADSCQ